MIIKLIRNLILLTLMNACMTMRAPATASYDSTNERLNDMYEYRRTRTEKTLSAPSNSSAFIIPIYIRLIN